MEGPTNNRQGGTLRRNWHGFGALAPQHRFVREGPQKGHARKSRVSARIRGQLLEPPSLPDERASPVFLVVFDCSIRAILPVKTNIMASNGSLAVLRGFELLALEYRDRFKERVAS
jgi:hypothetical protein